MTFGMNFLIFKFINTRDCIEELDGIKICIYNKVYGQHNLPHIYAKYCDYEVSVRISDVDDYWEFSSKKSKNVEKMDIKRRRAKENKRKMERAQSKWNNCFSRFIKRFYA